MSRRTQEDKPRVNYLPSPLALFKLRLFGSMVHDLLGEHAYLVGSVLERPDFRDVDVRILLEDEDFARIFGDEDSWITNPALRLANMAMSALARELTGLEVDCQFQQTSEANAHNDGQRQPLISLGRH